MSVGLLGSREQGNLRKCSLSALESALKNRGALGSAPESALEGAPESALEGALPVVLYSEKTLESTLGSTPESTPISESTLESTFEDFPVLGSLAGQQTRNTKSDPKESKSDCRGFRQSDLEVTPKVTFKSLLGSKSHFVGHFETLQGNPEDRFLVTFELLWFLRGSCCSGWFPGSQYCAVRWLHVWDGCTQAATRLLHTNSAEHYHACAAWAENTCKSKNIRSTSQRRLNGSASEKSLIIRSSSS